MKPYNFDEQKIVGEIGEGKVIDYLTNIRGNRVEDVREDEHYQRKDIDIILNGLTSVEIKTDTKDTPNFFFETISSVRHNTLGCFLKTTAEWIAYLKLDKLYMIDTLRLKSYYHRNVNKFPIVEIVKDSYDGRGIDIGIGALMNISRAEKALYKHIFSYDITKKAP